MFGFRKKHDERSVKEEPVVEEPEIEEKGEEVESVEKDEPVTGKYSVEAVGKIIEFVLGDRYDGFKLKDETKWFKRNYAPLWFDFAVFTLSKEDLILRISVQMDYGESPTKLNFDVLDSVESRLVVNYNPNYSSAPGKVIMRFGGEEAEFYIKSLETLPDDLIAVMEDGPYKDEGKVVDGYEQHGNIARSIRWKGRGLLDEPLDVKDADRVIEDLKNKSWGE